MLIDARSAFLKLISRIEATDDPFIRKVHIKAQIKLAHCEITLKNLSRARDILDKVRLVIKEQDLRTQLRYRVAKCEYWLRIATPKKAIK